MFKPAKIFTELKNCFQRIYSNPKSVRFNQFPKFESSILHKLCEQSISVLSTQNSLLILPTNIYVVGDLHGNVRDLVRILEHSGYPPDTKYLFLGDYVDRGAFSIETVTVLLALMCCFPNHVYLLRGNHEFSEVNEKYGFLQQIQEEYPDTSLWEHFNEVFSYMPVAALIGEQIFCVHGGLSPFLTEVEQINHIQRPFKSTLDPLILDIMWSDPTKDTQTFCKSSRGIGVSYGHAAVVKFLEDNKLKQMIRAHQNARSGVSKFVDQRCITVFSSSFYDNRSPNKCGYLFFNKEGEMKAFAFPPINDLQRKDMHFYPVNLMEQNNLLTFKSFKSNVYQTKKPRGCCIIPNIPNKKIGSNTQLSISTRFGPDKIMMIHSSSDIVDHKSGLPPLVNYEIDP